MGGGLRKSEVRFYQVKGGRRRAEEGGKVLVSGRRYPACLKSFSEEFSMRCRNHVQRLD